MSFIRAYIYINFAWAILIINLLGIGALLIFWDGTLLIALGIVLCLFALALAGFRIAIWCAKRLGE